MALRSFDKDDLLDRRNIATACIVSLAILLLAGGIFSQLDLDDDGLKAMDEWKIDTDPLRADTDGDNLGDGWEVEEGLNPLSVDSDNDTIADDDELANGTNPLSVDTDEDTLDDAKELELGTDPRSSDTDEDTLDDALELDLNTDPTLADTDHDGLSDAIEVRQGANPLQPDTDGDGIPDEKEASGGFPDCDDDGFPAIADTDDDSDLRPDGEEPKHQRCNPDVDSDGLLDGEEANPICIDNEDCDNDGLPDGTEADSRFDQLSGDTFDSGLPDSVGYAFHQSGQEPSQDDDDDGIPDAWETSDGLIEWGEYEPDPNQKDLLVEFVKVGGPSLADRAFLSPSYHQVANFFEREGGYNFDWTSTNIALPSYQIPPLLPSSDSSYYRQVLEQSRYAENPYVTTVVLNAHHDQREAAHLGVAAIRSMLAAVDYGAHSTVDFTYEDCDAWGECYVGTFGVTPRVESFIFSGRQDGLSALGYTSGGVTTDGRYFIQDSSGTFSWEPFWFGNGRNAWVETVYGQTIYPWVTGVDVDYAELAATITHEIGHTLGLCHLHEEDCRQDTGIDSTDPHDRSTMSYESGTRLHLFEEEWERADEYLTCPPSEPLQRIADNEGMDAIIEAKYGYTFETTLGQDVRDCQQFQELSRTLEPVTDSPRYDPDYPEVTERDVTEKPTRYEEEPLDVETMSKENDISATRNYGILWAALSLIGGMIGMVARAYSVSRPRPP